MAPARRTHAKRDLPPNLYEHAGYYSWRDPRSGRHYGIGRDKRSAIRQANEANFAVAEELAKSRLIDRINGESDRTFANFIPVFTQELVRRKLAKKTFVEQEHRLALLGERFGSAQIARVQTLEIAEFLTEYEDAGKARTQQAYRSLLLDFFREAQAKGWVNSNPVEVTRAAKAEVQRERLTLDVFTLIYEELKQAPPWAQRAVELGLLIGQRREDISKLQFKEHVKDGYLWIDQGKTGNKVKIPLKLTLDAVGLSLESVIAKCRDKVVSKYLIHEVKTDSKTWAGDKIYPPRITTAFKLARDAAATKHGLKWTGTPPTFHELRSLAKRLYDAQGVNTKALLGHKGDKMAALYADSRGADWMEVKL